MKRYKLIKKGKRLCTVASAVLFTAMGLALLPNNVKADVDTTNQVQVSAQQESNIKAASLNTDSQSNNNSPVVQQNNKELTAINPQSSTIQNGWQQSDNNTYYYQNGQKLTGQQTLNGKDYYFNSQGQQQKNYFLTQNNHTYYYQADGTRLNDGFYNNWGHTYYFQKDGTRLDNGFYNNWGHTYYFGQGGVRLDDSFYNNWGHTYYFQKDGARLDNGFYNNWGHTYYFGQGGVRLDNGFYNNWGHTYYFQQDGSRLDNGFYNNWGGTYYFGSDGARWDNRFYNNWGHTYYFGGDGALQKQDFAIGHQNYYVDANSGIINGALLNAPYINQYQVGDMACEATALLEALHNKGYAKNYDIQSFIKTMPIAANGNPNDGFGGGYQRVTYGIFQSIYPTPLSKWGSQFGNVQNISGATPADLQNQLLSGNPVVVYVTMHWAAPQYGHYWWGTGVNNSHVMTVDGYRPGQYHVEDPAGGSYWVSASNFENSYNIKRFAVVVK